MLYFNALESPKLQIFSLQVPKKIIELTFMTLVQSFDVGLKNHDLVSKLERLNWLCFEDLEDLIDIKD
jgi:hypothetical protein